MSARVLRKRARTEEDSPGRLANDGRDVKFDPGSADAGTSSRASNHGQVLKRDKEFWFDDGTVILVAGDVEFRVYKGILSSHSAVFSEIFVKDHPLRTIHNDGAQSTTCPVVSLSDSPEDLRHVLRAYMPRGDAR